MVTALAAAGLVAVGAPPGNATVPCQQTFTNSTSTPIVPAFILPSVPPMPPFPPVPMSTFSTVEVVSGTIADVEVTVNITNLAADQLSLTVQQGSGTSVGLKTVGGTAGANMAGTVFDDEATQDIASGAPPYSGRYRPTQALTAYDGATADGTWTLNLTNFSAASGTIDSWSVTITHPGCEPAPAADPDSDGVQGAADACPSLAGHTASGCPLASNAVTAKYRHGAFKGGLSSTVPACRAGRSVSIWKVRKGPDRLAGAKATASDGTYKLKRVKRAGRYYATSPRVVLANVAECPAVQSPTFRVR
jgi:subtilisin-like proprotein convertase family protein